MARSAIERLAAVAGEFDDMPAFWAARVLVLGAARLRQVKVAPETASFRRTAGLAGLTDEWIRLAAAE